MLMHQNVIDLHHIHDDSNMIRTIQLQGCPNQQRSHDRQTKKKDKLILFIFNFSPDILDYDVLS